MKLQLVFFGLLILLGCTKITQEHIDAAQIEADEATLVIEQWYDLLASGEFEAAAGLFDRKALNEVTPEVVVRVLRDFDDLHGPVEEYALQKFNFQIWEVGTTEEGDVIALTFDVGREKRQTVEYFDLIKRPGSNVYGIYNYKVTYTVPDNPG